MNLRPVTLADLAREAGTSPSTASRALSGRGYVSGPVRDRLLDAADRLGYVPNASARTLKQRTSRVIGVVVSDLGNEFYARLAAGIEQTLRADGFQMMLLGDNSDRDEEIAGARALLEMRVPGVIVTPVGPEAPALLAAHGTAVVEVDRRIAPAPGDAVLTDNVRGACDGVSHLLALGHERIALLVAATSWTTDAGRLRGYRRAHEAAGVAVDDGLVLRVPVHANDARERIRRLLADAAPTAVFAANNRLAADAWHAMRAHGLRLPHDVSLVAFDDVPWMTMVDPAITAVDQPTEELGRTAARLLLERLRDPRRPAVVETLQPSLVVRGSTARPSI